MFQIATPWVLALLPLPLILYFLLPEGKTQEKGALQVPFFQRVEKISLAKAIPQQLSWFKILFAFLIWSLVLLALSGPRWLGDPVEIPRAGRNILLAIDVSPSMSIPDMQMQGKQVSRLDAVKALGTEFINSRQGDRMGLIVFGTKAYLETPLTFDRKTVTLQLQDSSVGLAGKYTAIGDALGLSVKRLKDYPSNSRVLVLLTDGANNTGNVAPIDAATMAARYGIKIYTIGFGADSLWVRGFMGARRVNPSEDLDEKTLNQIAQTTGGLYFRAKDTHALKKVYETLNTLEPIAGDVSTYRPITPLYPWPLGLAFVLSLFAACAKAGFFSRRFFVLRRKSS